MQLVSRALLVGLVVLGAVPSAAAAATVVREGSEIVFRSAPGEADWFAVAGAERQGLVRFYDVSDDAAVVEPGAGCMREGVRENVLHGPRPGADAACDATGVTIVRTLTGDGDDHVTVAGNLPVAVDLGRGDDGLMTTVGEELLYSLGVLLDSYDLPSATVTGGAAMIRSTSSRAPRACAARGATTGSSASRSRGRQGAGAWMAALVTTCSRCERGALACGSGAAPATTSTTPRTARPTRSTAVPART